MINIVTGLPGAGKSYYLAKTTIDLLYENRSWYEKTGIIRKVASNLKLNDDLEKEFSDFITYWSEVEEIPKLRDCDVVWEEMGVVCDARNWESMPLELKRWFQQHRHRGVEIYGNVQEFADIDVAVRRLTHNLIYLTKLVGSRDPSPTKPPVKYIWGFVLKTRLDPRDYKEDMKFVSGRFSLDGFFWLNRKITEVYDMRNDIKAGKYPPLQHRIRICEDCGFKKVTHT